MMTKKLNTSAAQSWEKKWGLIFISPWLIGFLLFFLGPMIASAIFSFLDYNLIQPDKTAFIGVENWKRAIVDDPIVMKSIAHIFEYTLISLPISFCFSLIVALLLNNQHLMGKKLFRALFYLPGMIPVVATVLIWSGIMNEQTGWFNLMLKSVTFPAYGGFRARGGFMFHTL